ncbi:MAG: MFS transporter [Rhodospirillales bacterium]
MFAPTFARLIAGRLHSAWIALGVTFVTMMGTVGVRSAPGVIIVPLRDAFGWDVATISAAISLNLLLLGLVGPFTAGLMEAIGLKNTILSCLTVLLAGTVLSIFISEPWHLFMTWGALIGIGVSGGAMGMAAAVANRWFTAHRSLAMGMLMAANAAGQLVFLPILGRVAQDHGWRAVSVAVAVVVVCLLPVVFLFLPESPRAIGLGSLGGQFEATAPPRRAGNPFLLTLRGLADGVRSFDFWLIAVSFAICGFSTAGLVGTHFIAYCVDEGYSQVVSAGLLGSLGVSSLLGSIAAGWLTDRCDARAMLLGIFVLRGVSLMLLPYSGFDMVSLTAFAVFNGVEWVATVPPIVKLLNEVFGKDRAPVLVAWVYALHQVGSALAAMGAGIVREVSGSYVPAFLAAGIACLLAAWLVMRIGRGATVPA